MIKTRTVFILAVLMQTNAFAGTCISRFYINGEEAANCCSYGITERECEQQTSDTARALYALDPSYSFTRYSHIVGMSYNDSCRNSPMCSHLIANVRYRVEKERKYEEKQQKKLQEKKDKKEKKHKK